MNDKITKMENFEELKNVIFKKLQDEIKQVSDFHISGKFGDYQDQAIKYNKLYYTLYYEPFYYSDISDKLTRYGYTVEDIKSLMIRIATGLETTRYDVSLLNTILKRRKSALSFDDIFDLEKLEDKTARLQREYNELHWLKKLWLKYAY